MITQEGKMSLRKLATIFYSLLAVLVCIYINISILPIQVDAFSNTNVYTYVDSNHSCSLKSQIWSSFSRFWEDQRYQVSSDSFCILSVKRAVYTKCSYDFRAEGYSVGLSGFSASISGSTGGNTGSNSQKNDFSSHCDLSGMYQISGIAYMSTGVNNSATVNLFRPVTSAVSIWRLY